MEEEAMMANMTDTMDNMTDPCTRWIIDHNDTDNYFIPRHLELEWAEVCIGKQRMDNDVLWPLSVAYITMGLTGLVGNILVCLVISRNISMRSSTNFYLFNLAMADIIIILMGVTFDLSLYWHQYPWTLGEVVCRLRAWISEMTFYVSVLTIFCFSWERYLAICHPIYLYTMAGTARTTRLIIILWIVSALAAIPFAYYTKVNYFTDPYSGEEVASSAFCAMLDIPPFLYEFSSIIFFVVPMVSLVVMYTMMGWRMVTTNRRRQSLMTGDGSHNTGRDRTKKAVLKMLAVVVFCFFACWAPLHTQRLLYVAHFIHNFHWISEEYYYISNENLMYITGVFLYLNSTINPVIYNLISAKYRKAFKETLFSPSKCCRVFKRAENTKSIEITQFSVMSKNTLHTPRQQSQACTSCTDDDV